MPPSIARGLAHSTNAPMISILRPASHIRTARACIVAKWLGSRGLQTASPPSSTQEAIPLRKHLKEEAKRKRAEARVADGNGKGNGQNRAAVDPRHEKWELTVGIEIHAELNTACKLFSSAPAEDGREASASANSRVALFDAAMPGTQPQFQAATLLPAIRAAVALGCEVKRRSGWDRKHYFHWDQPNGYQITQYYEPFAQNGALTLRPEDGVPASDLHGADSLTIGIKQVQMEQDTAKTTHHPPSTYHVDLNRAGHPLIEIITLPQIHSPQTAAAVVRKIQAILKSVDACVTGMELGGLRADVNVSVRERHRATDSSISFTYGGVGNLGQRTEIKNLSSFKAVEDAITAEFGRQVSVLEAGGVVEGETRGWTLGATETTRLRGKEGEVDYRYMPDPDLPPLRIAPDLVDHLRATLPELPDATAVRVQTKYGLSAKDAKTLVILDDGDRLDFFEETVALLTENASRFPEFVASGDVTEKIGRTAGNWVLHELGGLLTTSETSWADMPITPAELAALLTHLFADTITARSAKALLAQLHTAAPAAEAAPRWTVEELIDAGNYRVQPLSEEEYTRLAQEVVDSNPKMAAQVREKGETGKVMWFVGQMVRAGNGSVQPQKAQKAVEALLLKKD